MAGKHLTAIIRRMGEDLQLGDRKLGQLAQTVELFAVRDVSVQKPDFLEPCPQLKCSGS
jgi:hypothetical protein